MFKKKKKSNGEKKLTKAEKKEQRGQFKKGTTGRVLGLKKGGRGGAPRSLIKSNYDFSIGEY